MSIGAIGAYSNYYGMSQVTTRLSGLQNNSTATYDVSPSITLHVFGDTTGEDALTAVGLPDGSSASVYKAESYSAANPEYKVKYWSEDGEEKEYIVNPKEVDPENASYIEMLAYTTYADVNRYTQNGFNDFTIAANGVNQDITYDAENIDTKYNFKSLVKEMMQLQYDANNLEGYLDYKKLFDYMDSESTES